jgi:hypothetical protein
MLLGCEEAIANRLVVAAIHRGRAVVSYRVDRVVLTGQTLAIRSTTQTDPSATAAFACPRILAVAGGGWFGMTVPRALLAEGKRRELEWVDCDRC